MQSGPTTMIVDAPIVALAPVVVAPNDYQVAEGELASSEAPMEVYDDIDLSEEHKQLEESSDGVEQPMLRLHKVAEDVEEENEVMVELPMAEPCDTQGVEVETETPHMF